VAKLNPTGTAVFYGTYLGGSNEEFASDVAVDLAGTAYVTGQTGSDDFPNVAPSPDPTVKGRPFQLVRRGAADAFVARIDPGASAASSLLFSSFLGGTASDTGNAIAVDADGHAWVTGSTDSTNFPLVNPLHGDRPGTDAFVTKVSPLLAGQAGLLYSTYFGGSGNDVGTGIAVDAARLAYITGTTGSSDLPLRFPGQATRQGIDAFVASLASGPEVGIKNLLYSTFVGGSSADAGLALALDAASNPWITGRTTSLNIAGIPPRPTIRGGTATDAFVARVVRHVAVDPRNGAVSIVHGVDFGTYLAGSEDDQGNGIAVAGDGSVSVVGVTASVNFPTLHPLSSGFGGGLRDAFVAKIAAAGGGFSGSWKRVAQRCRTAGEAGCVVRGVLRVHNPGSETAATSIIRVFLSADEQLDDGDRIVTDVVLRPVRAGRTRSTTVRAELAESASGQFLIAVLDAANTVPEVDESNNVIVSAVISQASSQPRD
jgi:hypothetical protein